MSEQVQGSKRRDSIAKVEFTERERREMYGAVNSQRRRLQHALEQQAERGEVIGEAVLNRMARLESICDKLTALQAETAYGLWDLHGRPTTRRVKETA